MLPAQQSAPAARFRPATIGQETFPATHRGHHAGAASGAQANWAVASNHLHNQLLSGRRPGSDQGKRHHRRSAVSTLSFPIPANFSKACYLQAALIASRFQVQASLF